MNSTLGLEAIAAAWNRFSGEEVHGDEVAYLIRQVHTTIGCHHGCTHCFASPPARRTTMSLRGFARLAEEFGTVARRTGMPYEFLFLGSATDPSSIPDFASYLATWIDALPPWSLTRFYTHGWLLDDPSQQAEFDATLRVLTDRVLQIEMVNVSIDTYSRLARTNIGSYVANVAVNIRKFVDVVGMQKLRMHILYPVMRPMAATETLLWAINPRLTVVEACSAVERYSNPADQACSEVTVIALRIGAAAGFSVEETISRSRDAGMPMAVGRGARLFRDMPESFQEEGLAWYRRKALPRLSRTLGFQIYPNGSVRVVDYDGYRIGPWLNDEAKVVPYLEVV